MCIGNLDWGALRRLTPVSDFWGFDRGEPIDRYYIRKFLSKYASDIQGHVLEVGDSRYTRLLGGAKVGRSDVIDVSDDNRNATIIADLANETEIEEEVYNCVIITQTFQYIHEPRAAVATIAKILKPCGVVLATVPGITRIDDKNEGKHDWEWIFTSTGARRLFAERFAYDHINIEVYGNVLTAIGFLLGLADQELCESELDYQDPRYEVTIGLRAIKAR